MQRYFIYSRSLLTPEGSTAYTSTENEYEKVHFTYLLFWPGRQATASPWPKRESQEKLCIINIFNVQCLIILELQIQFFAAPEGGLELAICGTHAKNKAIEKNKTLSIIIMMPSTYVCIHFMSLADFTTSAGPTFLLEDIFLCCAWKTPQKLIFWEFNDDDLNDYGSASWTLLKIPKQC